MDVSGTLSETYRYLPFGELFAGTATPHEFTGKERDQESGLDYIGARYLASNHGRWMSVDPVTGSSSNPQRFNRYSYVGNIPTMLVDPTGREWELVYVIKTYYRELLEMYVTEVTHFLKWVPPRTKQTFEPWEQEHHVGGKSKPPESETPTNCANQFQEFLGFLGHNPNDLTQDGKDFISALTWAITHSDEIQVISSKYFIDNYGEKDTLSDGKTYNTGSFFQYGIIWYWEDYVRTYLGAIGIDEERQMSAMFLHELTHAGMRGTKLDKVYDDAANEAFAKEAVIQYELFLDLTNKVPCKP